MTKTATKSPNVKADGSSSQPLQFGKMNYLLMLAGVATIVVGFILMAGKEDIFSPTKIKVAPLVVLAGFVIEVFAIFYKAKPNDGN